MKNSLFLKYFIRISAIILVSFFIIGVTMFLFVWKYSADEKQKQLLVGANKIAGITTSFSDSFFLSSERAYRNSINFITENLNADVFISDLDGNILASSIRKNIDNKPFYQKKTIPIQTINEIIQNGQYKITGNLNDFFNSPNIIVGVPFLIGDNNFGGVVIVSSSAQNIFVLMFDIMKMFGLALIFSLFITYILLYFATNKLLKPLKEMSTAAKNFANGNFNERITVSGNDEIARLAMSFNNMASSLATLEEMRSSFVSNVSHELKTPMTTIGGFIDGILDGTIEKEKQDYYLTIVDSEIKRLSRLVNSLLYITQINSSNISINPTSFDVNTILLKIVDSFELSAKEKGININVSLPESNIFVLADEDAIYRVMFNLTENAVKFCNENGKIDFKVFKDEKKVYISIKNTGNGIFQKDIPYIFDRFYKADKSRSEDKKGIGLGLYLCKQIMNLHKQEIWVTSKEGEYAEFVYTLTPA